MNARILFGLAMAGAVAVSAPAQTAPASESSSLRIGGYFSADYFRAQNPEGGWGGSFANGRGGVLFSGEWTARFGFTLEFSAEAGGQASLEQAWALVRASEAVQIRAGLYLVPFGRYNESRRAFQTKLVLDPYPVGDLFPVSWRDVGAVLSGRIGRLGYAGYIGNGLAEGETLAGGQQFRDNNRDIGRGGRISYALADTLEVGASLYVGMADAANSRRRKMWGADLVWGSEEFRLVGEYAKAEIRNPEPFAAGAAEGYFAMVSFKFGPVTPVAAYEALTYEDPFHGAGFAGPGSAGEGISRDETRWALGLVYPIHPNVLLKLEYDLNREREPAVRTNVLRVQAAVRF